MKLPIDLQPKAQVVFVLDRTMSMSTCDCPEGMSRWEYAIGAIREAMNELQRREHRCVLMTFGRDVQLISEHASARHLDSLLMGDAACCTGQAASEAIYFAAPATQSDPAGAVIIISDGTPDQDSRVGHVFIGDPNIMRTLFARTYFLTVGKPSEQLERFAQLWPHRASLESLMAADAVSYGEPDPHAMRSEAQAREPREAFAAPAMPDVEPTRDTQPEAPSKRKPTRRG